VHDAADRILSRGQLSADAPLVGAGIGRFLVRDLAASPRTTLCRLRQPGDRRGAPLCEWAARCAPAASIAR